MTKWRKFWQMSAWEQRLFLQSLVLLPLTALGLRLLGLKRFQEWLRRWLPFSTVGAKDESARLEFAHRAAHAVNRAAYNGAYRANCLQRSVMLWWLLRLRGIDSQLRIGVRKNADALEAHAWIEYNGIILNDQAEIVRRYSMFAEDVLGAHLV